MDLILNIDNICLQYEHMRMFLTKNRFRNDQNSRASPSRVHYGPVQQNIACLFARSLAPLTHLLAPQYLLDSRAHSNPSSWESEWLDAVLNHSALIEIRTLCCQVRHV